jgi:hypothetical protein
MSGAAPDPYMLPKEGLIFSCLSWVVVCLATFDPERLLRWLSYNRKSSFGRTSLQIVRLPCALCFIGLTALLVYNLFRRL